MKDRDPIMLSFIMESFSERFIKAIQDKISDSTCPLCKSSDWEVESGVYRFRRHMRSDSGSSSGDALPSAALICKVCGNIQFISVLAYGDAFKRDI